MANGIVDANERFLRDAVGRDWERTLVVSFPDDPKIDRPGKWEPESIRSLKARRAWPLNPEWNNYFCVSQFKGDAVRRESLFDGMFVLAVDDVGTGQKVDPGQLLHRLGTPTWAWETSPGNQQWIYRLRPRIFDVEKAKALALWVGGDAKGVTRVMRLPVGRNTKEWLGPDGFRVEEVLRSPGAGEIDIEKLWDVVSQDVAGTRGAIGRTYLGQVSTRSARSVDELLGNDVVGGWLSRFGMVKGLTANGLGVEIECPWESDHTVKTDSGTAYFPRTGGFECHHGHCAEKTGKDLRGWLEGYLRESGLFEGGTAAGQFDKVTDEDAGPVTPRVEFLRDVIYVRVEDKFWTLRDRALITRDALNSTWRKPLRPLLIDMREQFGGKGNLMDPTRAFFEMDEHQEVSAQTYWPGRERVLGDPAAPGKLLVNTWMAPARPLRGQKIDPTDIAFYRDLVRDVVGGEGAALVEAFEDWMAVVIGAPGVKPGWVAILLSEEHGIGKDLILTALRQGVGEDNVSSPSAAELGTQFSYYLAARLMIVSEFGRNTRGAPTTRDVYHILKPVTENTSRELRVRPLGAKAFRMPNIVASAITTNETDGMPMDEGDRRFAVFTPIDRAVRRSKREYAAIATRLNGPDGERVVEYYHQRYATMSQDRLDAVLGHAPMTQAKGVMMRLGENRLEAWFREQIENGHFVDLMTWDDIEARCEAAYRDIGPKPSAMRVGFVLRKLGARQVYGGNAVMLNNGSRGRLWAIRGYERFENSGQKQLADAYDTARALL